MAQIIKRPFRVKQSDGTYNKHYFETSEDLIMDAIQNLDGWGGYRKLPGGLILQWGKVEGVQINVSTRVNFPIQFPKTFFGVFTTVVSSNKATSTIDGINTSCFHIRQWNDMGGKNCYWFAIGC